jgi:hypothetical protein
MIIAAPALQGFRIIAAGNRPVAPCGIKPILFCKLDIGKTSLLWTLNALITQFMGFEADDVAVESCYCGTIRLRTWQERHGCIVFCVADLSARLDDFERLPGMIDQVNALTEIKGRTASPPTSSFSRS